MKQRLNKHVRMLEVAELAGVSKITVSRTLRSPNKVSDETRARVMDAIRRLDYLPNSIAASLSSNRTRVVAAVIPNIRNALYATMIQSLSEVLRANGLHLMISTCGHSIEEEEAVISASLAQRPCAFLLHHTRHTDRARSLLLNAHIPVVEVGDLIRKPLDTVVSYSNFAAAEAMTKRLIAMGYSQIAIIVSPLSYRAQTRHNGYKKALITSGLPYTPARRVGCLPGYDNGARVLSELLKRDPSIDAVLFSSISSAVGAWFECQRQGWRVPSRVAIASFDDTELAGWTAPPLTAVRLPRHEVGKRAGMIILDRLQGRPLKAHRVDLGFEILVRDST